MLRFKHCSAHLCDYKFELVDDNGVPAQGNSGLLIASKVGTDKVRDYDNL